MAKLTPNKPFLLLLYGFPGSGKTYFARQFSDQVQVAHVQADRIRHELFEKPRYDKQENLVVAQIVNYMVEEFLSAGVSVVYDTNVFRFAQRRELRDLARKAGAEPLLLWQQIDADSSFARSSKRDRRKADDRYALVPTSELFARIAGAMQNPTAEESPIVTSGKHVFPNQLNAVLRTLYQKGIITPNHSSEVVAKPGLVNLVPTQQPTNRADMNRRNVFIR